MGTGKSRLWACASSAAAVASLAAQAQAMEVRSFVRTAEGGRLTADFVVAAPPDQVYAVLTDDRNFREFMPYIVESETLGKIPGGTRARMRARRFGFFDFVVVYDRRHFEHRRRVEWREVGGYFKRDDGVWTLSPHPRGTLVGYEILLDPGFPVPDFLLSFALSQGLPEISNAVKRRAESGGRWKKPGA